MADDKKNLFYLDDLSDYKVASDYSDVRGWEVIDPQKRTIGKVEGLLVNKEAEKVVYLDVEVDQALIDEGFKGDEISNQEGAHGFINKDGERHLIIPIGIVAIDEDNKKVLSHEVGYDTFVKTKRYTKGKNIDRQYEVQVYETYLPAETSEGSSTESKDTENFYKRKGFQNRPK
ncbi:PRC-barrel domain-containing protein [Litoribacter populi]|uniref:PRC-barrel domain-containing protein n=1 Tax=Litoribacter populi TaxID=2598460 RepID=UPI001180CF8D|nr:PRC-barrel domain-containing protein [Litoribacter populi]